MKRGTRTIDGRVYRLGGRFTGLNARQAAEDEANVKRARGLTVRLIRRNEFDYMVYEL